MPSGKRAKQQRRAAAPPPVGPGRRGSLLGGMSRRTRIVAGLAVGVLIGVGVGLPLGLSGGSKHPHGFGALSTLGHLEPAPALGPPGPEGPPLEQGPGLAPAGSPSPGGTVDGISCESNEQTLFHIHARLTIFVDGASEQVPYGIGISAPQAQQTARGPYVGAGACFSWLHTHAADGIIHIESPVQRAFTLGNLFDVWGQPLSTSQVGPATGTVTTLVGNRVWLGDPRDVPLTAHSQIQLEVGRPLVAPVRITKWYGN